MNSIKTYGFIYIITNSINNKIYIGQKKISTNYKSYMGSGSLLKKAKEKYGRENFKRTILCVCYSKIELDSWEKYFIFYFDSKNREKGYNVSEGGCSVPERIADGYKENYKGFKQTIETVEKRRKTLLSLNRKLSDEYKKTISDRMIGNSNNHCSIKLINTYTSEVIEFLVAKDAAKFLGISYTNFRRYLDGYRIKNGIKYKWKYSTHIVNGYHVQRLSSKDGS